MKFLHYSFSDSRGGAAKAAYDLHLGLRAAGHLSQMVVRHKGTMDNDVQEVQVSNWRWRLVRALNLMRFSGRRRFVAQEDFNFDDVCAVNRKQLWAIPANDVDVVCIHWIDGLLTTRDIAAVARHYNRPVLWTMMDQEPMTGGCHYTLGCERYRTECGNCPQLQPSGPRDRSRTVLSRKVMQFKGLKLTVACGSHATQSRLAGSAVFSRHGSVITRWGIDERTFRPFDRTAARDLLKLPNQPRIAVFGAAMLSDRRKGMSRLVESLRELSASDASEVRDLHLAVLGHGSAEVFRQQPFPVTVLGYLNDPVALALAFQSADVFINPSLCDEGPMMLPQAMMCGIPAVSFATGYAEDLVVSGETGWHCANNISYELTHGLRVVLGSSWSAERRALIRNRALALHGSDGFLKHYIGICEGLVRETPP